MEKVQIKDIAQIITGGTPSMSDSRNYETKDIMFFKPSDLVNNFNILNQSEFYISEYARNKARILPPNSILVTCIGTVGKVGIIKQEATCNQQINAIIPNDSFDPQYIAYSISYIKDELQKKAKAPVVPILNKTAFGNMTIPYERNKEKQIKIANNLNKIQDLIAKKYTLLSKYDELVKSQFSEMFDNKTFEKTKWENVVKIINGKDHKTISSNIGTYPVYGSGGYMGIRCDQYLTNENSVIIGRKGNISKPIFVKEKYWNVDTAFGIETFTNKMNPYYFFYNCKNYNFEQMNTGATIPSLTKSQLLNLTISVPPMNLQNQFATFVKHIDKLKFSIKQSIEKLENCYNSLMQEYFN